MKQKILTFSPLTETELRKLMPETSPEQLFRDGKAHYEEAFRLFRKAAGQGSAEAQAYVNFYQIMETEIRKEKNRLLHTKSVSQRNTETKKSTADVLRNAKLNDIVRFGKYDWYVIKKSADRCTLLCKEIVCKKAYHETAEQVTWKNCTLRRWLNHEFYNQFTSEEKARIAETSCRTETYGADGGNTQDFVYLLSDDEADKLDTSIRSCSSWWWLRSPGANLGLAALVYSGGTFSRSRCGYVVSDVNGVRPVLTLKF